LSFFSSPFVKNILNQKLVTLGGRRGGWGNQRKLIKSNEK